MTKRTGYVTAADDYAYPATWDDSHRWNGWLAPRFDRKTVEALIADMSTNGSDEYYRLTLEDDGRLTVTTFADPGSGEEDYTEDCGPDADGLYTPGAASWTWYDCTDSVTDELINITPGA